MLLLIVFLWSATELGLAVSFASELICPWKFLLTWCDSHVLSELNLKRFSVLFWSSSVLVGTKEPTEGGVAFIFYKAALLRLSDS